MASSNAFDGYNVVDDENDDTSIINTWLGANSPSPPPPSLVSDESNSSGSGIESASSVADEFPPDHEILTGADALPAGIDIKSDLCCLPAFYSWLAKIGREEYDLSGVAPPPANQHTFRHVNSIPPIHGHGRYTDHNNFICPFKRLRQFHVMARGGFEQIHEVQKDALVLGRRVQDITYFAPAGPPVDPRSVSEVASLRLSAWQQDRENLVRKYEEAYHENRLHRRVRPIEDRPATPKNRPSLELDFPEYFAAYNIATTNSRASDFEVDPPTVPVWPTRDAFGRLRPGNQSSDSLSNLRSQQHYRAGVVYSNDYPIRREPVSFHERMKRKFHRARFAVSLRQLRVKNWVKTKAKKAKDAVRDFVRRKNRTEEEFYMV